jgi:hypothetical protein
VEGPGFPIFGGGSDRTGDGSIGGPRGGEDVGNGVDSLTELIGLGASSIVGTTAADSDISA